MLQNRAAETGAVGVIPSPRVESTALSRSTAWTPQHRSAAVNTRRMLRMLQGLETALAAGAAIAVVAAQPRPVPLLSPLFLSAVAVVLAWPALLGVFGTYSVKIFGTGSDEYRRVIRAGSSLMGLAGFISYAGMLQLSRALVVVAIPALTVVTLLGRCAVRRNLRRLWARGRATRRVLVVGRGGSVLELTAALGRERSGGLEVVAACVTDVDRARVAQARDVPVGGLDDVLDMAARHRVDAIAVTSASETAAGYLRRLSWQLEGSGLELLVAPGLVEVAGPRLHIRPFEGLPLLSVEQPRFEGWRRLVKATVDRTVAAVLLVVLAPLLVGIGLAVRASSEGPVFYRQERVGLNGRPFLMVKFRSMVVDAERQVDALRRDNISDGLLFKLRVDPRVTPVGRWLRRLSLDELPQLFNILGGSMSLVGPRPPLPGEVARYDSSVSRRLLVKPGLTGLWQISGRSDLSWEESVRLDLRYVENWSLATDLVILGKTLRAVLGSSGAY